MTHNSDIEDNIMLQTNQQTVENPEKVDEETVLIGDGPFSDDIQPLLLTEPISDTQVLQSSMESVTEFERVKEMASRAILAGVFPKRIPLGSSGSYFVYDPDGICIAVFKPKNEEPYGEMNPKWMKWFHRKLCPCLFGRSCLLPNQGYISEAGASVVDQHFFLGIVPTTEIVCMISETFHYSNLDRANVKTKALMSEAFPDFIGRHLNVSLPPKIGSLQQFVHGYLDASFYIEKFKTTTLPQSEIGPQTFQANFEKLVVLDYIIRNTDRNNDNWLVRIEKKYPSNNEVNSVENASLSPSLREWNEDDELIVSIAAIDNGLAFPYKHPDSWRRYPFHWAFLPFAKIPFSDFTKNSILPLIKDLPYVEQLVDKLLIVFKNDKSFNKTDFERQMAVMRGQITNLVYALENNLTPYELTNLPPAYLHPVAHLGHASMSYIHEYETRPPYFTRF